MIEDNYTAKNIRILRDEEIREKFEWVNTGKLAHEYKLPLDFVERGFECCRRLGIKPQYFIDKYIIKKQVDTIPEFEGVYRCEPWRAEREGE